MMRSMFAGVSGLRNHQIRMDVVGNNIANVNTVAFKAGRVNFHDVFSQTIRGASAPNTSVGGSNPQQVGLGVTVSSLDTLHIQGNLQLTGKMTDLGIQGNGFFVLRGGGSLVYTRAGNFDLDGAGYLVNPSNGLKVQGWMAVNGVFPNLDESNLVDVQIPVGGSVPAQATTQVKYVYNLDASSGIGGSRVSPVKVYDSLGNLHNVDVTFTKTGVNQWDWTATALGGPAGGGTLTFDPDGSLSAGGLGTIAFNPPGADPVSIDVDFSAVTQFAAETTVTAAERNGYPMGVLDGFTMDSTGVITGVYSNGLNRPLAQISIAQFANPGGLLKLGEGQYQESNNSGLRQIGPAGTGGRGKFAPGNLEMSNVDLAREFTEIIVTQRGFQANSRVITTSDEMLQDLVNLKR
ncbi:MAG: flagellar hook protein FlgE [Acetobacteraceae bacterium]|nr:flagellar hook protein FlgE [Acetobacteraceae bacterium]